MATKPATKNENGAKRGRKPAPEGETPALAFVRLAQSRTSNILDAIDSLGNLASGNYIYTEEQTAKICKALHEKVIQLEGAFKSGGKGSSFSLT